MSESLSAPDLGRGAGKETGLWIEARESPRRFVFEGAQQNEPGHGNTISEDACLLDTDLGVAVVSDGMGGHGNGEKVSQAAVEAVQLVLGQIKQNGEAVVKIGLGDSETTIRLGPTASLEETRRGLSDLFAFAVGKSRAVSDEIHMMNTSKPKPSTTLLISVAVEIDTGVKVLSANLGDSRLFLIPKDGEFKRSKVGDDGVLGGLVDQRFITAAEALAIDQAETFNGFVDWLIQNRKIESAQRGDFLMLDNPQKSAEAFSKSTKTEADYDAKKLLFVFWRMYGRRVFRDPALPSDIPPVLKCKAAGLRRACLRGTISDDVRPHIAEEDLGENGGDVLLTTDGLSDLLPEDVIANEIGKANDPSEKLRRLEAVAKERKGVDGPRKKDDDRGAVVLRVKRMVGAVISEAVEPRGETTDRLPLPFGCF